MTDIVERLRELAREYHQHRPHYTEAADEIELLRAERDFNRGQAQALEAHNNELHAEIERLRAALDQATTDMARKISAALLDDLDRATRNRGQRVAT